MGFFTSTAKLLADLFSFLCDTLGHAIDVKKKKEKKNSLYGPIETYDRVHRDAPWKVLKIYGVGSHLLEGVKAFAREATACVKVNGKICDNFATREGVTQGCVMSPWLFNVFFYGWVYVEIKVTVGNRGARLGDEWSGLLCCRM